MRVMRGRDPRVMRAYDARASARLRGSWVKGQDVEYPRDRVRTIFPNLNPFAFMYSQFRPD